jgi:hypothetical protein
MAIELDSKRGVTTNYGVRTTTGQFGRQESTKMGIVKSVVWDFTYLTLPTASTSKLQFTIPANATIVSAKLVIDTAFTSTSTTTDLSVGLQTAAGAEIDNDGLLTTTNADQTAIAVANSIITGSGALVGKGIGATAGELVVTASVADLLTGSGRVIVEYIYNK